MWMLTLVSGVATDNNHFAGLFAVEKEAYAEGARLWLEDRDSSAPEYMGWTVEKVSLTSLTS